MEFVKVCRHLFQKLLLIFIRFHIIDYENVIAMAHFFRKYAPIDGIECHIFGQC